MPQNFEKLSVPQLKSRLIQAVKLTKANMAPMLYYLRKKIKAQGKAGQGFGHWVEEHLEIHRRTADRWADQWAIAQGLKKPAKKVVKTFRQLSKSIKPDPAGNMTVNVSLIRPEADAKKFMEAMDVLGEEASDIIYTAVVTAASKKPVKNVTVLTTRTAGAATR